MRSFRLEDPAEVIDLTKADRHQDKRLENGIPQHSAVGALRRVAMTLLPHAQIELVPLDIVKHGF